MEKIDLKDDTIIESELHRVYKYKRYLIGSKIYSDKGFRYIDNGSTGRTHWTAFYMNKKMSRYFDPIGGNLNSFLIHQSPKPVLNRRYKIQDIISKLCESYCLYFFYPIERMVYYDAILRIFFD